MHDAHFDNYGQLFRNDFRTKKTKEDDPSASNAMDVEQWLCRMES